MPETTPHHWHVQIAASLLGDIYAILRQHFGAGMDVIANNQIEIRIAALFEAAFRALRRKDYSAYEQTDPNEAAHAILHTLYRLRKNVERLTSSVNSESKYEDIAKLFGGALIDRNLLNANTAIVRDIFNARRAISVQINPITPEQLYFQVLQVALFKVGDTTYIRDSVFGLIVKEAPGMRISTLQPGDQAYIDQVERRLGNAFLDVITGSDLRDFIRRRFVHSIVGKDLIRQKREGYLKKAAKTSTYLTLEQKDTLHHAAVEEVFNETEREYLKARERVASARSRKQPLCSNDIAYLTNLYKDYLRISATRAWQFTLLAATDYGAGSGPEIIDLLRAWVADPVRCVAVKTSVTLWTNQRVEQLDQERALLVVGSRNRASANSANSAALVDFQRKAPESWLSAAKPPLDAALTASVDSVQTTGTSNENPDGFVHVLTGGSTEQTVPPTSRPGSIISALWSVVSRAGVSPSPNKIPSPPRAHEGNGTITSPPPRTKPTISG